MQGKHLARIPLLLFGIMMLAATAGCFQPAGSGFEQPIMLGGQPTFTIEPTEVVFLPTNTPEPSPTTADLVIEMDTPTPVVVAALPSPTLEPTAILFPTTPPLDNSSTINSLLTPAGLEVAQLATATLPGAPALNPFEITATFIVGQATLQAGLPATQTAQAIFGAPATATPNPLFPTPPPAGFGTPVATVFVQPGVDCVHEVQATDRNLYRISLAYGVTVAQIAQASGITNINLILVGQRLTIPGCGTTGYRPPPTSIPANSAGATPGAVGSVGGGRTHIVEQGETLFEISLQYGVPVATIAAANGIADINRIFLGQTLTIP